MGGREAKACLVSQVFGCAALLHARACVLGAGNRAGDLGLPGVIGRVKTGAPVGCKKEDAPLSRQDSCPGGGHRFIMDIYIIFLEELCRKGGQITCKM